MSYAPPRHERVMIQGPAGEIETIAQEPAESDGRTFAVICHPHPLHGGTMDNKVVVTIARALHEAGVATLRFNFRGVGVSAGTYDEGRGELFDAQAVTDWGMRRWPGAALMVAGFSFGSYVALRMAQAQSVIQLITVAPAVTLFDFTNLQRPDCSWLIIQGDADEVVDPKSVMTWAADVRPAPTLALVAGAGHFFHGRLIEVKQIIIEAIRSDVSRSGS